MVEVTKNTQVIKEKTMNKMRVMVARPGFADELQTHLAKNAYVYSETAETEAQAVEVAAKAFANDYAEMASASTYIVDDEFDAFEVRSENNYEVVIGWEVQAYAADLVDLDCRD
jgi:hypothetical protein